MSFIEGYRVNGGPAGEGLDKVYPGESFDPLGLADDPDTFAELKARACMHYRLHSCILGSASHPACTCECAQCLS